MYYRFTEPITMPRATHYGNDYWIFPSVKTQRRVVAYSMLEFYNLLTLEMDPHVKYYCPQPTAVEVVDCLGQKRQVTFDVYVVYANGAEEMQEVKYDSDLNREDARGDKTREQIRFESLWADRNDINFIVRTDKEIMYNRFVIPNLLYLFAFVKR